MFTHIFVTNQLRIDMRRDVFQAIADPIRRDIIDLVSKQAMTVNAIADNFDISRPAISKHIRILSECGVVAVEKKGRERHCAIQPRNLIPAYMWMYQHRKLWEEKLNSFEEYLMELKDKCIDHE